MNINLPSKIHPAFPDEMTSALANLTPLHNAGPGDCVGISLEFVETADDNGITLNGDSYEIAAQVDAVSRFESVGLNDIAPQQRRDAGFAYAQIMSFHAGLTLVGDVLPRQMIGYGNPEDERYLALFFAQDVMICFIHQGMIPLTDNDPATLTQAVDEMFVVAVAPDCSAHRLVSALHGAGVIIADKIAARMRQHGQSIPEGGINVSVMPPATRR